MTPPYLQIALEQVERLNQQAEQLRPCWEELLEKVHAVGEQIQERVQKLTADAEPSS